MRSSIAPTSRSRPAVTPVPKTITSLARFPLRHRKAGHSGHPLQQAGTHPKYRSGAFWHIPEKGGVPCAIIIFSRTAESEAQPKWIEKRKTQRKWKKVVSVAQSIHHCILFVHFSPSLVCCDRQNIESHISYTRHLFSQRNCFLYALIHHFKSRRAKMSDVNLWKKSFFKNERSKQTALVPYTTVFRFNIFLLPFTDVGAVTGKRWFRTPHLWSDFILLLCWWNTWPSPFEYSKYTHVHFGSNQNSEKR